MVYHDLICFGAIACFQCVQILSVFIHSTLDTAFHGQGVLGGQADQVEKALEDLVKLTSRR